MMKLSQLYCSSEATFPTIKFNEGLNVIFARVKDYHETEKDAHNLGKTFLTTVIDFCLLSSVDATHPFREHPDRFSHLTFYLELKTTTGMFVTVRRQVTGSKSIAVNITDSSKNLRDVPIISWTHGKLGKDSATSVLDEALALTSIRPYDYRKGLGYFLRRQNDYDDLYRISKFGRGRDLDWKPFMALLLGFDFELVARKYELDDQAANLQREIDVIEGEAGAKSEQLDEVRGRIALLRDRITSRRSEADSFDFYEADLGVTKELVHDIEANISTLNEERYRVMSQLEEVRTSLETELTFDIARIKELFRETGIYFPEAIRREYEELIEFNRSITQARKGRLIQHRVRLESQLSKVDEDLKTLDARRATAAAELRNAELFERYKALQRRLLKDEEDLLALEAIESRLDSTSARRAQLREFDIDRARIVARLEDMIDHPPSHYREIRKIFGEVARDVLDVFAVLTARLNNNGNLDFGQRITRDAIADVSTSEGEGFSYQKLLCVCFDLALLCAFSDKSFYRFVYHDGVFEALDNRRKNRLLTKVRDLIDRCGIQYVLTVIDSDLPRDLEDSKLFFSEAEIIRELHDADDSGRLFPGPAF